MTGQPLALLFIVALTAIWPSKEATVEAKRPRIPLVIDEAHEGDLKFVWSSWKHSAADAPKNHKLVQAGRVGEHFTRYNERVERVMDSPALILVAREPTDPQFIYGWIAAHVTPDVALLYQYTKGKYRRLGVARSLKDAVLREAPESARRFYCDSTIHDAMFESWGFTFRHVDDVLGRKTRRRA